MAQSRVRPLHEKQIGETGHGDAEVGGRVVAGPGVIQGDPIAAGDVQTVGQNRPGPGTKASTLPCGPTTEISS